MRAVDLLAEQRVAHLAPAKAGERSENRGQPGAQPVGEALIFASEHGAAQAKVGAFPGRVFPVAQVLYGGGRNQQYFLRPAKDLGRQIGIAAELAVVVGTGTFAKLVTLALEVIVDMISAMLSCCCLRVSEFIAFCQLAHSILIA